MSKPNLCWLFGYLVTLAVAIGAVIAARNWALAELSSPEARAQWEEYKVSAGREAELGGPVERKIPRATEPPTLIMLRDRFWVVMLAALVFASLFYGFSMFVVRGLQRSAHPSQPKSDPRA